MSQNSPQFHAEGVTIALHDKHWFLHGTEATAAAPLFQADQIDKFVHFSVSFAQASGLPEADLPVECIQAVVAGFDEKHKQWRLGLHLVMAQDNRLRFIELAHWPQGEHEQYAADSQVAANTLAEVLHCPLKLLASRKTPQMRHGIRSTITGPMEPHQRLDLDHYRVQSLAKSVEVPLSGYGVWFGETLNGMTLQYSKKVEEHGTGQAHAYDTCVLDKRAQTIRLTPATGLLGEFFAAQGRVINFRDVRNIELRYATWHEVLHPKDGSAVEMVQVKHQWVLYLTLLREALMLLKLDYTHLEDRTHPHVGEAALGARERNRFKAPNLSQQVRETNEQLEKARFAESVALVTAATMNVSLVKTTVDSLTELSN